MPLNLAADLLSSPPQTPDEAPSHGSGQELRPDPLAELRPDLLWRSYLALALGLAVWAFARMPIFAGDTDLWYHLNAGRYIWQHRAIPTESFFSFVSPPRPWVDYYWLFQALVHAIHSSLDYPGLIALRLLAFVSILAVVAATLSSGQSGSKKLWAATAFSLFSVLLVSRYMLVRPHLFSYLFLAVFLLVLETRRRLAPILPLLAILWVNLHGVTFPVMLLVCLAYLADLGIQRVRSREPLRSDELRVAISLTLCLVSVFVTPHGGRLLEVPFVSTQYASQYIWELVPVKWGAYASWQIRFLLPNVTTAVAGLALLTATAAIGFLRSKPFRLAPWLLAAGGAALLARGQRFGHEFALLTLPLLRNGSEGLPNTTRLIEGQWLRRVGFGLLAAGQVMLVRDYALRYPRFPFSPQNLPVGVAHFLRDHAPGGDVLNFNDSGGYLEWALYPKHRIFMDMQVPFLFTDEDIFTSINLQEDAEVFRKFVTRYRPGYVSMTLKKQKFKEVVAAEPRYRPIFFDDAEVLYADRERYPELVRNYELRAVNPFALRGENIDDLRRTWDETAAISELRRVLRVYPDCGLAHQVLAMVRNASGEPNAALGHAAALIAAFPDAAIGYKLKGDALRVLKRPHEALTTYREAEKRAFGEMRSRIRREMGITCASLKDFKNAYRWLREGVAAYGRDTGYKDLYHLAAAALSTGRIQEAKTLYGFALEKVPPSDAEWTQKLRRDAAALGVLPAPAAAAPESPAKD